MLELRNIRKKFGHKLILEIPSFDLSEGIYWIGGLNGSGKTTLLKIIAGALPFSGDVLVNGASLKNTPVAYRKLTGYAEAEPLFPGFLSGQEMVDFQAYLKKEKAEVLLELIEKLRVNYFLKTGIGTYSSGMIKRLSLVLAFTGRPKLILLDEPLVTLDAEMIPAVYALIKIYRENYGTSFLLTSHQEFKDPDELISRKLLVENQTLLEIA